MSFYTAIYYVDITTREGMSLEETINQVRTLDQQRRDSGYDQAARDQAAQQRFTNGAFEDTEEEVTEIIEEFSPPLLNELEASNSLQSQEKLDRKTTRMMDQTSQ